MTKYILAGVLLASLSLAGCATTSGAPRANDAVTQLAVQAVTLTAVGRVVTRDNASPELQAVRATRIVNIASALKAFGADELTSLPAIKAALDPLLDKLQLLPLERQQADLLVDALVTVALERSKAGEYVARVEFVLDEVIKYAGAYIPPAPEPSTL